MTKLFSLILTTIIENYSFSFSICILTMAVTFPAVGM